MMGGDRAARQVGGTGNVNPPPPRASAREARNCAVLGFEIASSCGARSSKYLLQKQRRNGAEKVQFGDDIGVKREPAFALMLRRGKT
jgi:hypothetical protein